MTFKPKTSFSHTNRIIWISATMLRYLILLYLSSSSSNHKHHYNHEDDLRYWLQNSSNLQSILIHPLYTVRYIQRAQAVRQLSSSSSSSISSSFDTDDDDNDNDEYSQPPLPLHRSPRRVKFAYTYHNVNSSNNNNGHNQIHLPPLVLFVMEMIIHLFYTVSSSTTNHWFYFRMFLLFIDFMIAIQLYHLVTNLLSQQDQKNHNNQNEIQILQEQMNPKLHPSLRMLQLIPISSSSTFTTTTVTKTTTATTAMKISSLIQWNDLPMIVSLLYYLNPITILATSISFADAHHSLPQQYQYPNLSWQNIITFLIIHTLYISTTQPQSSKLYLAFLMSILSYIDIHLTVLFIPIVLLLVASTTTTTPQSSSLPQIPKQPQPQQNPTNDSYQSKVILPFIVWYIVFTLLLHLFAMILVGFQHYYDTIIINTHLHTFQIFNNHLSPNLSLLWYFGMEIFVPFHTYFTWLLGGLPYFTIVPMTIRLYQYPSVLLALFWMLGVLFRPSYNTLYQWNIGFCFMLMNPRTFVYMNPIPTVIALCAIPIPVILYSIAYWMWLEPMNGEANFLYFQCLVYNILIAIIFLGFAAAALRRDKALRMTMKPSMKSSDSIIK